MFWHYVAAFFLTIPYIAVLADQFTKNHLNVPGMNMYKPWTFKLFGKSFTIPPYFFPHTGITKLDVLLGRNDLIHMSIGTFFGYGLLFAHLPWAIAALISLILFLVVEIHEHDVRWDNTFMHILGTSLAILIQLIFPFTF